MSPPAAIEIVGVTRRYPRCVALEDVSLSLLPGEVHTLVGENGAGKSTAIRILAGLEKPDLGEVRVGGAHVLAWSPVLARGAGVGVVHQHFTLVDTLTAAENAALGREPRRGPAGIFFDREAAREALARAGRENGMALDPDAMVDRLSVGERQRIEVAKALAVGASGRARVLILDEPTAVLTPGEARDLLAALRRLRDSGAAVLLVTHKLDEVFAVANRITVLRTGRVVGSKRTADTSASEIARLMIGDVTLPEMPAHVGSPGDVVLEVRGLVARGESGARAIDRLDLDVRAGEVLGVAGVDGNGQAELVLALAGLLPADAGTVRIGGRDVTREGPRERIQRGEIAHVAADRHRHAVLLDASAAECFLLGEGRGSRFFRWWGIDRRALATHALAEMERLDVRPLDPEARIGALSGGNQQKVVLARELARGAAVLLAAQPTRGVDLGASARIRAEILRARDRGAAVLLVSSDLAEVRALSDRVAVMLRGRFAGVLSREAATEEALAPLFAGAHA